jgi:hypothetical protein
VYQKFLNVNCASKQYNTEMDRSQLAVTLTSYCADGKTFLFRPQDDLQHSVHNLNHSAVEFFMEINTGRDIH